MSGGTQQDNPLTELDTLLTAPKRLAAVALLTRAQDADFRFVRDHLGVTDSDLSKHMAMLEAAGYLRITKTGHGRGATTTYRLTRQGRRAYQRHRAALEAILGA